MFKPNDQVFCNLLGVGVVQEISEHQGQPCLKVKFNCGDWDFYRLDGRPFKSMNEEDVGLRKLVPEEIA